MTTFGVLPGGKVAHLWRGTMHGTVLCRGSAIVAAVERRSQRRERVADLYYPAELAEHVAAGRLRVCAGCHAEALKIADAFEVALGYTRTLREVLLPDG